MVKKVFIMDSVRDNNWYVAYSFRITIFSLSTINQRVGNEAFGSI